ncbi:MAG TPA: Ldh family oxidoreductase [Xanthobacteraceae bacterium]|nr:Ldh family oxidoreductase [Xanthobacteraceae bacterium]
MSDPIRIGKDQLLAFVREIFVAAGIARDMAEIWADVLVWANLRGVDSHGVLRVPRYLDLIARKSINPEPDMRTLRSAGAIAVIEADRAPGAVAMVRAVDEAIRRAREVHIGWCAVRNISHAGAIGYFALRAAQAGFAGLVMAASGPMMAYHGARVSGVSTNPLAIAVPGKKHPPFLLDMSTATVANGKVLDARDRGVAVPLGWGIDAEGRDTTDPKKIATLLPVGGAKGSGLSFMIECLCSLAVSNPRIAPALAGTGPEDPLMNAVAMAVDLAALGDADAFGEEADRLGEAITALPRAEGVDRILLPGERGDQVKAERERTGIPIAKGTWTRLVQAAERVGVPAPA